MISYLVSPWIHPWAVGDDRYPFTNADHAHGVIFSEGDDGTARIANAIITTNSFQEDYETMTLLIPDRERDNQEDFIWCLPIPRDKWDKWFALSQKFKCVTPDNHGGVRYANRMEGREVRTVIVMPTPEQDDDCVVHACAFLRMVKQITCRIYVIRCQEHPIPTAKLINSVAGTDPAEMPDVELEDSQEAT